MISFGDLVFNMCMQGAHLLTKETYTTL